MAQCFNQHKSVHCSLSKRAKKATEDWIASGQHSVFGSLLFQQTSAYNEDRRIQLLRLYFGKMDSLYFGNAASRKNMRIPRQVAIHKGANSDNLHAHFVITPIGDTDHFCRIARLCWASLSNETYRYSDIEIEVARKPSSAACYLLHESYGTEGYCPLLSASVVEGQNLAICNAQLSETQKNKINRFVQKNNVFW